MSQLSERLKGHEESLVPLICNACRFCEMVESGNAKWPVCRNKDWNSGNEEKSVNAEPGCQWWDWDEETTLDVLIANSKKIRRLWVSEGIDFKYLSDLKAPEESGSPEQALFEKAKEFGSRPIRGKKEDDGWRVKMSRELWKRLMFIGREAAPNEIQMVGEVERNGRRLTLVDVHLLPQHVTGASAKFDPTALALFVASHPHPERLTGFVHCHVEMGCFWSNGPKGSDTDLGTIMNHADDHFVFSLVYNLKGQTKARVDIGTARLKADAAKHPEKYSGVLQDFLPFLPEVFSWDDIPVEIEPEPEDDRFKSLREKVKAVIAAGRNGIRHHEEKRPEKKFIDLSVSKEVVQRSLPILPATRTDQNYGVRMEPSYGANAAHCMSCEFSKFSDIDKNSQGKGWICIQANSPMFGKGVARDQKACASYKRP